MAKILIAAYEKSVTCMCYQSYTVQCHISNKLNPQIMTSDCSEMMIKVIALRSYLTGSMSKISLPFDALSPQQ